MMDEQKLQEVLSGDETAYGLLYDADPKLITRFKRLDGAIVKLLADVKKHFPDAEYYTASGGFNLLLGPSHSSQSGFEHPQSEMSACGGLAHISDGDY